jgi:curli biogenesis system outer membrane secretion channel CsgG
VAVNLRMVDTSTAAVLHSTRKVVQNPEKPVRLGDRKKEKSLTRRAKSGKGKAGSKSDSETGKSGALDRLLRAIYDR